MSTKRVISSTTDRHVNVETGVVIEEVSTNVVRLPQEPPYIKMYVDDLCLLIKIPDSQKQLLMMMLQKLDYDGYVTLSPRYRKSMCQRLGIKDQTLRNRLVALCKSGVMQRHSTNEYEINPRYFARGEWRHISTRRDAFEMRIKYTADGEREIVTERIED